MDNSPKPKKKLKLSKSTIKVLQPKDLKDVVGGARSGHPCWNTYTCLHWSCY